MLLQHCIRTAASSSNRFFSTVCIQQPLQFSNDWNVNHFFTNITGIKKNNIETKKGMPGVIMPCIVQETVIQQQMDDNYKGLSNASQNIDLFKTNIVLPELKKILVLDKLTRWEVLCHEALGDPTEIDKMKLQFPGMFETHKVHSMAMVFILNELRHKYKLDVEVIKAQTSRSVNLESIDAIISAGGDGTYLEAASLIESSSAVENNESSFCLINDHENIKKKPLWIFGINTDPSRSEGRLLMSTDMTVEGHKVTTCYDSASLPVTNDSVNERQQRLSHVLRRIMTGDYLPIRRRRIRVSILESKKNGIIDSRPPGVIRRADSINRRQLLCDINHMEENNLYKKQLLSTISKSTISSIQTQEDISYSSSINTHCLPLNRIDQPIMNSYNMNPLNNNDETRFKNNSSYLIQNTSTSPDEDMHQRNVLSSTIIPLQPLTESLHSPMGPFQDTSWKQIETNHTDNEIYCKVLEYRAVNDVLLTTKESHMTLYAEIYVDNKSAKRSKNSGIIVCTGSGSSAWAYNISKVSKDVVSRVIQHFSNYQSSTVKESLVIPDISSFCQQVNSSLIFDPSEAKMRYVIREPIDNRVFSTDGPADNCHRIALRPLTMNACLSLDGLSVVPIKFAQIVLLEIDHDEDALFTAT